MLVDEVYKPIYIGQRKREYPNFNTEEEKLYWTAYENIIHALYNNPKIFAVDLLSLEKCLVVLAGRLPIFDLVQMIYLDDLIWGMHCLQPFLENVRFTDEVIIGIAKWAVENEMNSTFVPRCISWVPEIRGAIEYVAQGVFDTDAEYKSLVNHLETIAESVITYKDYEAKINYDGKYKGLLAKVVLGD